MTASTYPKFNSLTLNLVSKDLNLMKACRFLILLDFYVVNSFSLEQNRFFKGTQAFANPTDLASSRCMGKCFPCPDTWFCWCQRKKFSL